MKERVGIKKSIILVGAMLLLLTIPKAEVKAEEVHNGDLNIQKRIVLENTIPSPKESISSFSFTYGASSVWDTRDNDYYYNRLSATQKTLYDNLFNRCLTVLLGNENLMSGNIGYVSKPYGISDDDAMMVAKIVLINCPQFYFLSNYITVSNNGVTISIYSDFANGATRASYTSQFNSKINQYLSEINTVSGINAKVKKAYDLLKSTKYEFGKYDQSCAGVFFEGKAVCAGISEAFQLLVTRIGASSICVVSETHEWNKVYLNGTWTNIDVTNKRYSEPDSALPPRMYTPESWHLIIGLPGYTNVKWVYNGVDYSPIFNPDFYASRYGDLRAGYGNNASQLLSHFVNHGMSEGRQGSSNFNVNSYRLQYADLRRGYGNDLKAYYMHYLYHGMYEGRKGTGCTTLQGATTTYRGVNYSAVYDYNYYIKYTDLARSYGDDDEGLLAHFVNHGMSEGRRGNSSFDVKSYKLQYADLRRGYGSDLKAYYMHYVNYGKREGRKGTGCTVLQGAVTTYGGIDYSAVYDFNFYKNNGDLARAFGEDDVAMIEHFVNHGMSEGRQGNSTFNVYSYRNQYADLRAGYGKDLKSYYMHYVYYGKREGRKGTGCTTRQGAVTVYGGVDYSAVYDYNFYKNYADLYRAYGGDDVEMLAHFVNHGMSEGRRGNTTFNVYKYKENYADLRAGYGDDYKAYYMHYVYYGRAEGRKGA